jgi:hypothetical protein
VLDSKKLRVSSDDDPPEEATRTVTSMGTDGHEVTQDPWGDTKTRPPSSAYPAPYLEIGQENSEPQSATQLGMPEGTDPFAPDHPSREDSFDLDDLDSSIHDLPLEMPMGAEETTSRMAALVSDELRELRSQFKESTIRNPSARRNRSEPTHPPQEFTETEPKPTARQRLVADLYDEARKAKKL